MKKLISLTLTLALMISLTGCNQSNVDDSANTPNVTEDETTSEAGTTNTANKDMEETVTEEPRALSSDELAYFNETYFNGETDGNSNLANQFLYNAFDTPADIDLFMLFYMGAGSDYTMNESDGEGDAVAEAYGFDGWADIPTDVTPIPSKSMNDLLVTYTGTTLEESNMNGLENFKYLEEYDCYYNLHGDTNYFGTVEFTEGTIQNDTLHLYYHNSWQDADYMLTLTGSDEDYLIYSNLPTHAN